MNYSLYVVRHGEAGLNRDRIVMGTIDSPLTPTGIKQAETLHTKLSGIHFDEVYSSPLKRAVDTAMIVSGNNSIETDTRLLERTFGVLEGQPLEKLNRARELAHLSGVEAWEQKLSPDTESDREIYIRVKSFLDEKSKNWSNKVILVGTHSGPARALLIGLGFYSEELLPPGEFKNGSCAVVRNEDGKFSIVEIIQL